MNSWPDTRSKYIPKNHSFHRQPITVRYTSATRPFKIHHLYNKILKCFGHEISTVSSKNQGIVDVNLTKKHQKAIQRGKGKDKWVYDPLQLCVEYV